MIRLSFENIFHLEIPYKGKYRTVHEISFLNLLKLDFVALEEDANQHMVATAIDRFEVELEKFSKFVFKIRSRF